MGGWGEGREKVGEGGRGLLKCGAECSHHERKLK